jgi:hypothetical protein
MVRPLKEINWDVVERLIESGCSGVAIASKFRIQKQTFYERFKKEYGCSFQDYHTDVQEAGLADIMSMLHAKALNNKAPGNSQLLIFLARVRLGMKEPETTSGLAANQIQLDQSHLIMQLQYKISQLEENANIRQAE